MTTTVIPRTVPSGLLAAVTPSLADHLTAHGPVPENVDVLALVEAAGLRGRGGANFPMAVKMRAVRPTGRHAVVVANGAEGEPASRKDNVLLAVSPHLVLDGLQLAASAVRAGRSYLVVTAGAESLGAALAERKSLGGGEIPVDVLTISDRFLAGEETALVSAVSGGSGLPRGRKTPVWQRGVSGRPTLVQNVETLARLALLVRRGGGDVQGTFLATISGAVREPGVRELAVGQTVTSALDAAGGASEALSAVLVGGYHGGWLPAEAIDAELSAPSLSPYGLNVGAGVLVALPASRCGLVETARVTAYLAAQSARQCGPCLNGLPALADRLNEVASGRACTDQVDVLLTLVAGRGACHHPDGVTRFVRSALRTFAEEVRLHAGGRCSGTSQAPVLPVPGPR